MEAVMFIDSFKNNGNDYLRLVETYRTDNGSGKKVIRRRIICNIGPLSKYDDGKPDYLKRLRESFRKSAPLIPELEAYTKRQLPRKKYQFSIEEGSSDCIGHPRLYSQAFLEMLLRDLNLVKFFVTYKNRTKIEYDLLGFFRLLVFGRILCPASKLGTLSQNDDYYDPILTDFNPFNVYDTLDFIYENKDRIKRRMNTAMVKKLKRNPKVIFYDVTNFFFQIDDPDEDYEVDGATVVGVRKCGVSKEERTSPIVQMGLFMDDQGIPISIEMFPGNTLDCNTFRTAISKSIDNLEYSRFILIGDRGMCTYRNILYLLDQNNGYIIAKSLLKSTKAEREWAYSDDGYTWVNQDFKYKTRIVKRTLKDQNGEKREISEKVVIYWTRGFYERDVHENARFLETLERILKNPKSFRVTYLQAKVLRPFLQQDIINAKTGEVFESSALRAMIDEEKVNAYKANFGFYQIVTSELEMDPVEIIDKYHGLARIEDQFRVLKSDLETRPIFVRKPEHIEAHLTLCFIALVMMRMIQHRISESGLAGKTDPKHLWNMGLTTERIQTALNKWRVDELPNGLYRFCDIDDPDLKLILDAFGIKIPLKLYTRAELKSLQLSMGISP